MAILGQRTRSVPAAGLHRKDESLTCTGVGEGLLSDSRREGAEPDDNRVSVGEYSAAFAGLMWPANCHASVSLAAPRRSGDRR